MSPDRQARVDARVEAMPLSALRKARRLTQQSLSQNLEMSQGDVSKPEQRTECYVSTLRNHVRAIATQVVAPPSHASSTKVSRCPSTRGCMGLLYSGATRSSTITTSKGPPLGPLPLFVTVSVFPSADTSYRPATST